MESRTEQELRVMAQAWRDIKDELLKTRVGKFAVWCVELLARVLPEPKEGE